MSRSGPYWKNETTWICPKHLPSVKIPAIIERCFYVNCSSVRPERVQFTETVAPQSPVQSASRAKTAKSATTRPAPANRSTRAPAPDPRTQPVTPAPSPSASDEPVFNAAGQKLCAWFKCDKGEPGGRAITRTRSKYCSRDCSNRNARWRHKNR